MKPAQPSACAAHVRALAEDVAKQAANAAAGVPESVHDLRVATRRLDAALRLWGGGHAAWAARRAAQDLRRAAGPAREAEVMRELLARRWGDWARLSHATRTQWLEELAVASRPPVLPEGAAASVRSFSEAAAARLEAQGDRVARAAKRARNWRRELVTELTRGLDDGSAAALHRARLALKLWRYAEESLAHVSGSHGRPHVRRVRPWQQALGDLNDLALLVSFLSTRPPAGPRFVPAIERRRLAGLERLRRAVLAER